MNVDELKTQLADYDQKLDRSLRLNARLLHESGLQRASSTLRGLSRALVVELVGNAVGVALLGNFLGNHWGDPKFVVPAILLDLCAILLVVTGARQLAALHGIDYGAPILAIQKKLETLRAARIRTIQWTLILSPLLWTPLLIVALKGFFGVDAYAFGAAFLASNLLFGLAFLVFMVWVSRRYADRMQRSPAIRRLMDSIAGRSLNTAMAFLESLSRLEREDTPALG